MTTKSPTPVLCTQVRKPILQFVSKPLRSEPERVGLAVPTGRLFNGQVSFRLRINVKGADSIPRFGDLSKKTAVRICFAYEILLELDSLVRKRR